MSHLEPAKPRRRASRRHCPCGQPLSFVTTPLRKLPRAVAGKRRGIFFLEQLCPREGMDVPEQFQLVLSRKMGPGALSAARSSPREKQGGWGGGSERQPRAGALLKASPAVIPGSADPRAGPVLSPAQS